MRRINLGAGEIAVASEPGMVLQTLGLGSCVAVIILEPTLRMVGMAHIALPDSSIDLEKARVLPGYFADTGLVRLMNLMFEQSPKGLKVLAKLVGGASVMDSRGTFNIGVRNALAIKKTLWKHRIAILGEDLGGNHSRSVYVDVDEGRVVVTGSNGMKYEI